ncbi:MAG TPA: hypothetical protein VFY84_19815 [Jiangellales bacterium]|nr:hypothetical protein [Jiangellales bacterium]
MTTVAFQIIVEPDPGGWWLWEVSTPDAARPMGRHVLMESSSRWRWLAISRALLFAWQSRNNRYYAGEAS